MTRAGPPIDTGWGLPDNWRTELATAVVTRGWVEGVASFVAEMPSTEKHMFLRGMRMSAQGAWVHWVGRADSDLVVNLDTSLGGTTLALGQVFTRVYGLFAEAAGSACYAERAKGLNRGAPRALRVDGARPLPFPDGTFDSAVVADIGAWLVRPGSDCTFDGAIEHLSIELARVLKRDGTIFVGVSTASIAGAKARFGTWGAGITIRRALRRRGFGPCVRLLLYPSLSNTVLVAPLDAGGTLVSRLRKKTVCAIRGHSIGMLASRNGPPPPGIAAAGLLSTSPPLPRIDTLLGAQVGTAGSIILLQRDRVIRAPFSDEARDRCAKNDAALRRLGQISALPVPQSMGTTLLGCQEAFVESRLPGEHPSMTWNSHSKARSLADQAMQFLARLRESTGRVLPLRQEYLEQLIRGPLESLWPALGPQRRSAVVRVTKRLRDRLTGGQVHVSFTHGDFKRTNLLVVGSTHVTGVIDWDLHEDGGLSIKDPLMYLAYELSLRDGIGFGAAICKFVADGEPDVPPWFVEHLAPLRREGPHIVPLGAFLSIAHGLRDSLSDIERLDTRWLEANRFPALDRCLDALVAATA